jgi:type II secretory pathway pseudopilin PulG
MQAGERGFSFLFVLFALAAVSLALAVVGPAWAQRAQRDREQELLRLGAAYAQAIASYHDSSPGSQKQYPLSLEHLLEDPRFVGLRRHLRRLYGDPANHGQAWGLVRTADGRIRGVYSLSDQAPLIQQPQDLGIVKLPVAQRYSDWKFTPDPQP